MYGLIRTATTLAFMLVGAMAAQAQAPGPLVDANWLSENAGRVTILDVRRNEKAFITEGHIAGAVFVPWGELRVSRSIDGAELVGMHPGKREFEALMQGLGVGNDSTIVIVNGGRNSAQVTFATRLYWQLKYFGHEDVALLDGGMAAWRQARLPVVHHASVRMAEGSFVARDQRRDLLATTDEVEEIAASRPALLLDARDFGQYLGLYHNPRSVPEGGHIPGARFFPIDAFLSPGAVKTFLDDDILRKAFHGLGVKREAVTYCNTGHLASGTWFILHELAGYRQARLYDGSLNAWLRTGHPVVAFRED